MKHVYLSSIIIIFQHKLPAHLSRLGTSLKIMSLYKSGFCIGYRSRITVSTSSLLWNRRPTKCRFSGPDNRVDVLVVPSDTMWGCIIVLKDDASRLSIAAADVAVGRSQIPLLWGRGNECLWMAANARARYIQQRHFETCGEKERMCQCARGLLKAIDGWDGPG
jgi:hypothetical protein